MPRSLAGRARARTTSQAPPRARTAQERQRPRWRSSSVWSGAGTLRNLPVQRRGPKPGLTPRSRRLSTSSGLRAFPSRRPPHGYLGQRHAPRNLSPRAIQLASARPGAPIRPALQVSAAAERWPRRAPSVRTIRHRSGPASLVRISHRHPRRLRRLRRLRKSATTAERGYEPRPIHSSPPT
jgi:hypothetical protein